MDVGQIGFLFAAGVLASGVNAVAGGGSLVTFPALLAVGLPPIPATVTNAVAVCPGYLASAYGSRTDLRELAGRRGRRAIAGLAPTVVVGTAIGCTLLLVTPAKTFDAVVPFLVLAATTVLAFQQRLKAYVGRPQELSPRRSALTLHAAAGLGAIYGGYFNAALGVMLVAALSLAIDDRLARVNALKNAVSAVIGLGTVLAYGVFGPVDWAAVAALVPGTLLGGYIGSRVARRLPGGVLRAIIISLGAVVAVVLFVRAVS